MSGGKHLVGILSGFVLLFAGGIWLVPLHAEAPKEKAPAKQVDPALARTRKTVQMLDTIYKTAIVLITKNYVTEESDLPAGAAFKALFNTMKEGGYHEVRLIDATGEPYEKANAPADAFEKEAIAKLKAGEPYFEKIVEKDGHKFLRAATPIPVVMEKCVMCHANYADAKPGAAIGALGYTIPIE